MKKSEVLFKLFLVFIVLGCNYSFSQFVPDTTFTIHSEFKKHVKKFPTISIAKQPFFKKLILEKDICYKENKSRKLTFDYFRTSKNKVKKAVILIHGGGWKSGNKTMCDNFAIALTKKGFHCFTLNYSLSDEAIFPAAVEDIHTMIDYIKQNKHVFLIDMEQIALVGFSSGGQLASLIGLTRNDIKAVVNVDGIMAFHHPESQEGKLANLWLGGTYQEKQHHWQNASPLHHIHSKAPKFLFLNSDIPRFHAGRDDAIVKLNNFKIFNQTITLKNTPHTFWFFNPWYKTTRKNIIKFLQNQLN